MSRGIASLTLEAAPASGAWGAAFALLQAGVRVRARSGASAREFMRESLGFEDGYIEGSVSTVFVDSEPVDDIDEARVGEGSLVALSAAMPGLVGAVMRRGSPYASFREGISRKARPPLPPGGGECLVRLRLFNSVMRDRGPALLGRGVVVGAGEARELALLAGRAGADLPPTGEVLLRLVGEEAP